MTLRYLSYNNGFVPEATGQVIAHIRDPKRFALPKYAQYVKAPAPVGLYAKLERDASVRVPNQNQFAWNPGSRRPQSNAHKTRFEWVEFACQRKTFDYTIDWITRDTAAWKVQPVHTAMATSMCMSARTQRVKDVLTTPGNWPAGHTNPANTWNGGSGFLDQASYDEASPNFLAIKKTFDAVILQILLDTNAQVAPGDIKCIMGPEAAQKISQTSEIHKYLAQSPYALAQVKGDVAGQNRIYGLPDMLYGVELEIEDSPIVTEYPKASGVEAIPPQRAFIWPTDSIAFVSRVGGIDGTYGTPSFSTLQLYYYDYEIRVMAFDEAKHELTDGYVDEFIIEKLAAPYSGALVTDAFSP